MRFFDEVKRSDVYLATFRYVFPINSIIQSDKH